MTEEIASRPLRLGDYTPELGVELCEHLANGGTLQAWCREVNVSPGTVWKWGQAHSDFRGALALAREAQAFYWANEIIEMSDDGSDDWKTIPVGKPESGKTKEVFHREHYERTRLRIQTRQWLMARYSPHLFGDKVEVTHESGRAKRSIEELQAAVEQRALALGQPVPDFKALLGRQG